MVRPLSLTAVFWACLGKGFVALYYFRRWVTLRGIPWPAGNSLLGPPYCRHIPMTQPPIFPDFQPLLHSHPSHPSHSYTSITWSPRCSARTIAWCRDNHHLRGSSQPMVRLPPSTATTERASLATRRAAGCAHTWAGRHQRVGHCYHE